jgi:hypothetical protein
MNLDVAIRLIEKGILKDALQTWADLGAGSGLFTNALSRLLPHGSSIIAIDKKLSKIVVADGIYLQAKAGDFLDLDFGNVDGVLMANSLHYVKEQRPFVETLLSKAKRVILVEYNTDRSNTWVPYAISFDKLKSMNTGEITKLADAPSSYHKEGIYSAQILPI